MVTEPLVMETLKERLRAFKDALSANNITFDDSRIIIDDGLQLEKAKHGYEVMAKILKKNKPGAVFAPSDSIVFGAMNAAIEKGFKIPEDVSFMGNGNSTFAQFSNPPLTTIKQNKKKMGTRYTDKFFHDTFMYEGTMPFTLFEEVFNHKLSGFTP